MSTLSRSHASPRSALALAPLPDVPSLPPHAQASKALVLTDLALNFEKGGETFVPGAPLSWYLFWVGGWKKCTLTSAMK